MQKNPEQLTCISIIVCENVYRDETTKNLIIIGTFNKIAAPKLPCTFQRMCVLFTVTNGRGTYNVALSIVHEETAHQVAQLHGPMTISDPLAINDINVELRNLVFPSAGKYWVELKADDAILQQRPFLVEVSTATAQEQRDADR
jgi:hypothetical protein